MRYYIVSKTARNYTSDTCTKISKFIYRTVTAYIGADHTDTIYITMSQKDTENNKIASRVLSLLRERKSLNVKAQVGLSFESVKDEDCRVIILTEKYSKYGGIGPYYLELLNYLDNEHIFLCFVDDIRSTN